jgi:hypothetical protein
MENDLVGIIHIGLKVYKLETINNSHVIMLIDQSKFPSENCTGVIENDDETTPDVPNNTPIFGNNEVPEEGGTLNSQTPGNYVCKLRVLVMYTTKSKNSVSNINNHIQLAIDGMNQSFINSQINYEVELAYAEETSYSETSTINTDVVRFHAAGDGYMDNIHSLRETYSADVCVLLAVGNDYCGVVKAIKACNGYAFCVVRPDCAVTNYSFAHEIGHLVGCRHNTEADGSTSPYSYGHGYTNCSDGWKTIMALNTQQCSPTRLQYWSNPNVTYGGVAMGSSSTRDNARVLNTYIPNVMSHRPLTGTRTVVPADINSSTGVIYNAGLVKAGSTVTIDNGQNWAFYSSTCIELNPCFTAKSGSCFVAEIIPPCGSPDNESCNYDEVYDLLTDEQNESLGIKVYPNPSKGIITITNNGETPPKSFKIVDYLGRTIVDKQVFHFQNNNFKIDISYLPVGIYLLQLIDNEKVIATYKIVKD